MTDFFRNLRLSLTQWLAVSAAFVIGGLVLLLRMQGRRLHKAQVELLETRLDAKAQTAKADTAAALANYKKELDAYVAAGGKL